MTLREDNADDNDEHKAEEREVRRAASGPAREEPQQEVRAPHDPRDNHATVRSATESSVASGGI